ncbi:hypothetical protein Ddye_031881 [Dipteronia dyeriana]|uniref:Uncharacterized protein n=1 Tax=Dipteronia dyeriana TaxID=168575 RepID=A0AAD9TJ63_9ROSI|nr:hypothetical protein Ddye_031881 [Dipteronia dyeriana]
MKDQRSNVRYVLVGDINWKTLLSPILARHISALLLVPYWWAHHRQFFIVSFQLIFIFSMTQSRCSIIQMRVTRRVTTASIWRLKVDGDLRPIASPIFERSSLLLCLFSVDGILFCVKDGICWVLNCRTENWRRHGFRFGYERDGLGFVVLRRVGQRGRRNRITVHNYGGSCKISTRNFAAASVVVDSYSVSPALSSAFQNPMKLLQSAPSVECRSGGGM